MRCEYRIDGDGLAKSQKNESTKKFIDDAKSVFRDYQVSAMVSFKWHGLEHLVESLEAVGGGEYLHAGYYESAHKVFMQAFQ